MSRDRDRKRTQRKARLHYLENREAIETEAYAADRLAAGLAHNLEHEDTIAQWTDGITGWHTTAHRSKGDSHRLGRTLSLFPA